MGGNSKYDREKLQWWMSLSWQHRESSCFWLIAVQILWSIIICNYRDTQPLLCWKEDDSCAQLNNLLLYLFISGKEYRIIILVGVSSVSFGAVYITIISIINFCHSLNSFEELREIAWFMSVAGKVVEQQQEDDEAIIVLVFNSPNDLRHWPGTTGEGWSSVTQIYHGCFSVRSDWVVSRSGRKSC